jgi:hypothetical protein
VKPDQVLALTILPGEGTGTVTSFPHGFVCQSGQCFAPFQAYTLVQLRAELGVLTSASWQGCLRQTATRCEVYANAMPSVKVRFDRVKDSCVTECEALCERSRQPAYESCAFECRQCLDF